jgi:thiamine-monophosphate kinase
MPSEFSFIEQIRKRAAASITGFSLGIGDDAAMWCEREGRERLVSTDLLIEDVHFSLEYTPLDCLGYKALAISLSDIAAMGGSPDFALLSLGIPHEQFANLRWDDFFAGYFSLAEKYNIALIGGDTSASPDKLVIDSIVLGASESKSVRRSGAKVGDAIYVTGSLGASAVGLRLLQRGERLEKAKNNQKQAAIRAHLRPEPRVEFGQRVCGLAHSMMDVSDGLAQDLAHICEESQVDTVIDFDSVPLAESVALITATEEEAFSLAVNGGEDYELLLTSDPDDENDLMKLASETKTPLTRIGEIVARASGLNKPTLGLRRAGQVELLIGKGYDHFRESNFVN